MPSQSHDITIIGAGALGCAAALHLARAGANVVVLERESEAALHASGKSAGMFRQLYRHPQLTEWAKRSLERWPDEIRNEIFSRTGSIIIGRSAPGHHTNLFQNTSFTDLSGERSAVLTPGDGLFDPKKVTLAYARLAVQAGAKFVFRSKVQIAQRERDAWHITLTSGEFFRSKWIVNAAGAWLNVFLEPGLAVESEAFARHLIEVSSPLTPATYGAGFVWDEEREYYFRSWRDGSLLASLCDRVPADPDLVLAEPPEIRSVVVSRLSGSLGVAPAQLGFGRIWHCFRTYVADGLPVWGEDPLVSGLFWLGAFGGFGMSTSYTAAEDAANYILTGRDTIGPCFLPSRCRNAILRKAAGS